MSVLVAPIARSYRASRLKADPPQQSIIRALVTDHDVKPEQIARVRVRARSNILNPLRYKKAKTELEAKFCLPFI